MGAGACTWRRDLRGPGARRPGLSVAGPGAMAPAAGQPGAGGVCEEETGEFRGPRHGQKKAPALRTRHGSRESGCANPAQSSWLSGFNDSESIPTHHAKFTVSNRCEHTWVRIRRDIELCVRDILAEHNGQFSHYSTILWWLYYIDSRPTIIIYSYSTLISIFIDHTVIYNCNFAQITWQFAGKLALNFGNVWLNHLDVIITS